MEVLKYHLYRDFFLLEQFIHQNANIFYLTQDSPESDAEREKDKKEKDRESEKDRTRQRSESKHKSPKKKTGKDSGNWDTSGRELSEGELEKCRRTLPWQLDDDQ